MKSVLISIQPKWVEKIASGQKTIEVRKTAPKCEIPFKCYIYVTKEKKQDDIIWAGVFGDRGKWNGRVIGEFICDNVIEFESGFHDDNTTEELRRVWYDEDDGERDAELFAEDGDPNYLCTAACLTWYELKNYVGTGYHTFYGLHISDLKIYDKPKELSEFKRPLDMPTCGYTECGSYETPYCKWLNMGCEKRIITRPPQSWCYVEEL